MTNLRAFYAKIEETKNQIIELAQKLDDSGKLAEILSEEEVNFQQNLTRELLFFSLIIMSELDHSKIIIFDHSFQEYFNNIFVGKDTSYLKKTYQCE